jgi:hypothetical protein
LGGIPLDDASPARVRLRGQGRLADKLRAQARRPAREPDRAPVRDAGGVVEFLLIGEAHLDDL